MRRDVQLLSDSAFHGRGYVLDGSNLAASYLEQRFREVGLQPVQGDYYQPFSLVANVYEQRSHLRVGRRQMREGYDFIADPWSGICEGRYRIQRFDSSHFQRSDLPELRKGRVPVIDMRGIDSPDEVSQVHSFKLEVLKERPFIELHEKLTWSVGQRRYEQCALHVDRKSFPKRARRLRLSVQPEMRTYEARNVIGMLPGLRSDSCLLITAHYDHLGRMGEALFAGASDNASGTATMLDLATYFAQIKPPMDMYFIAFAGEEAGLAGSKYFVENPMVPLEKMRFLVNIDLMGSASKGIAIVNGTLYPDEVGRIGAINREGELMPKIRLRGKAANSDHYWFAEAGVPAIFIYTEGNVSAYHDVHDLPEGLDWARYEELFTLLRKFIQSF